MGDGASGLREAVAGLAARDRSGWSGPARSAELVGLLAAQERLAALVIQVAGQWDRDQAWALDGTVSPVAWLAHRAALTRLDASVLVRTARHCAKHDPTAKALDAGDVTAAHVQIAARAARHREDHYPEHETVILDAARTLAPSGFREVMRHWAHCVDAISDPKHATRSGCDPDDNHRDVAQTFENVGHLQGRFDALSIKALIDVLDAMEPADPTDLANLELRCRHHHLQQHQRDHTAAMASRE
ncbi:MAG: hypothetical protein AMXMBFR46_27010 [Acidimicrobiia bacterium]